MSRFIDLTGQRFGRLTVVERAEDRINPNGDRVIMYRCLCDCGKEILVRGGHLRSRKTTSCGCKRREIGARTKKFNEFKVDGNTVKVRLSNCEKWMYVDLDKWETTAKFKCWRYHRGYAAAWDDGNLILCHVLLFPDCPTGMVRDHIDGDRLNNRASNIRFVTVQQNSMNHGVASSCSSGVSGVYMHDGRWRAHIFVNGKHISLGIYDTLGEAKRAREKAELKYFGEYRRK